MRLLATTILLLALGAAPASAATITDAPNDGGGDPGHDITAFDWAYDATAGTVTGTFTVAGDGADAGLLMGFTNGGSEGDCTGTDGVLMIGAKSVPDSAVYTRITGGEAGQTQAAQRSGSGTTYTITTPAAPELAGLQISCVQAQLTDPQNSDVVYDTANQVAPPTPAPTAQPTPAPTPAPVKPAAKLRATLKGIPKRVKRGKGFRPTLTIANRGNAASKTVIVRFKSARGLSVKPRTIKVKGLKPGKSKRIRLRVSLGRKARASTPFVVSAKGGGLSVTARKTLRTKPAKRKPKPKPKPGPAKGGLPGTFWWWNELTSYKPFNVYSLRFYDNGYAYYRLPEDGQSVPDKCESVTSVPDKDGEFGPGCVKWDLDGTKLTFSDPRWTGTYANGKLEIRDAEKSFEVDKFAEPQAGKRFNFSYKNIETTGFCGAPGTYCSVVKSYLTLQDDGTFGLQEESSSTLDTGGSFTYTGSFPPENRGTYEVLSGYRIKLSYADGKTEIVPFGLIDGTSSVDDAVRVVLGRLPFWVETEDG